MSAFLKNILESNHQLTTAGLSPLNLNRLKGGRLSGRGQGYDSVIVVGMGGSGLAGELLKGVAKEIGLQVPVFTWKDYGLPEAQVFGAEKPLYVFVSFSGNTEETLSGFKVALKTRGLRSKAYSVAAVTHGGELARLAHRAGIPFVLFPAQDLNPRQHTGRMFYALTQILCAAGLIPKEVSSYTQLSPARFKKDGRGLAQRLRGKIVLIYTDQGNYGVGCTWKAKLNETAKQVAFLNVLPEMNHNEIAGLAHPKTKFTALFISDAEDRLRKRIQVNLKLLKKKGVAAEEISLIGETRLEKMWNSIMLADWTAYELAKLNGVDPAENKTIEELKKLMKK